MDIERKETVTDALILRVHKFDGRFGFVEVVNGEGIELTATQVRTYMKILSNDASLKELLANVAEKGAEK